MGERLNLEIRQGGELLANAYYHWSAYTRSALDLTEIVLKELPKINESDPVLKAIRLLEATNAGLTPAEKEYAKQHLEGFDPTQFQDAIDRNEGLIAISEEGMAETRRWQEGSVTIHLDDQWVELGVCWFMEDKEEYCDDYEETEEEYEALPVYSRDISEFSFNEIQEVKTFVEEVIAAGHYKYRLPSGAVTVFVE